MEGTYPVMMEGKVAGSLVVTREGAMRVFSLRCRYVEGIVRMSVYGEEGEGYLGIPVPEEGELRLVKRLSPTALRDFPAEIIEAGPAGHGRASMPVLPEEKEEPPCPEENEEEKEEIPCDHEEEPKETCCEEPKEECQEEPEHKEEEACETHTCEEQETDSNNLYWYSSPDGALVCFDGERSLVALPLGDARIPRDVTGQRRTIEGREYLVYATKNSRIEL